MPAETRTLLRRFVLMGVFLILATAAVVVLICYTAGRNDGGAPGQIATQATVPEPTLPRSQFESSDFGYGGDYLTCLAAECLVGIDVSVHQQQIDWEQVKAAGIDFVMVRLGYRGYETGLLNEDKFARANLDGARQAGLLVGAYFFSQATGAEEAKEEARFSLEILGDFSLDLPLVFDWEMAQRTENVDKQTVTECALAFCAVVEGAGLEPMIYFNSYQTRTQIDLHQLADYAWWLALYNTEGTFPCRFDMWQYSSEGTVPGIEGNVDLNVMITEKPPA